MTVRDASGRLRQPVGAAGGTGGQFAEDPTATAAADVELGQGSGPWRRAANAPITDDAEMLEVASRLADIQAARASFGDRDDLRDELVGRTLTQTFERKHANPQMQVTRGYLSMVMSGFYAKEATGGVITAESRKAKGIYLRKVEQRQAELGRLLTVSEEDAIAEDLRTNWQSTRNHRPQKNFHRIERNLSLDAPVGESGDSMADFSLEDHHDTTPVYEPGTRMADALLAISDDDATNPARAEMWNILADNAGAPQAVEASMSAAACTKARAFVTADGGAAVVARQWDETGEDTPASNALFAPFGDLDGTGREQVVDLLLKNPDYADDMWGSAMTKANSRNAKKAAAA